MSKKKTLPRQLRSKPMRIQFAKKDIDVENGIIKNVTMCQVGEAKGHDVHLEQEFIENLVKYDNKYFKKAGLKCRFSHPGMSDSAMGKQLGKFQNFQVVDDKAVADLHLLESANLSPDKPGMKDWMLSMAQESPDFVMSSIVFYSNKYYQRDETGKKRYCDCWDEENEQWVDPRKEWGNTFVEFNEDHSRHYYTDMVEAGAATDNLFSAQFNQDKFAVRAIEWVKENEDIHTFLKENPAKLLEFATQLGVDFQAPKATIPSQWKAFRNFFFTGGDNEELNGQMEILKTERDEALAEKETLTTQLSEANAALETAKEALTTAQSDHQTELAAKDAEIKKLSALPADTPTDFEPTPIPEGKGKQDNSAFGRINRRAQKSYKRRNK